MKRPTVFVYGVNGVQESRLREWFSSRFDLSFLRSDRMNNSMPLPQADCVIAMINFIHHHHTEKLLKAYGEKCQRCPGGISAVRKMIEQFALTLRGAV